jgi:3-oxoacyl-[acyl-carrier protein] reductase
MNASHKSSSAVRSYAIVTGTSSGIGLAVAEKLLKEGWQVHGIDRSPAVIRHAHFQACTADLTQPTQIDDLLKEILTTPPQALVHAAGMLRVGALDEFDPQDGQLMWQLHVDAAVRLGQRVLPLMRQARQGRLVMIGSRVSGGMPGRSLYAASKSALIALAKSWAAECVRDGITVNVVSPAATATSMLLDPQRAGTPPKLPPIGRLIQAEEVAELVHFLMRPEAAAITGQDVVICGGASLNG